MRKSLTIKAGVAGLILAGAGVAGAQTNGPTGITARVGVFFPTSQFARDLSADWFSVGADYKFNSYAMQAPSAGTMAYLGLSADYYSSGNTSALPIALTYNVRSGMMVYSIGAGIDFVRIGDNTSGFAGQVAVAYDFGTAPTPFMVQAKYFFSSKSDLSGFGVYAGVRF